MTTIFLFTFLIPQAPILAANTKLIAFTFDDGPSEYTNELLDGLEKRGIKATFFMTGSNGGSGINNHPDVLERMVKDGDQLANHTYEHLSLANLSASDVQYQITMVGDLITKAMGGSYRYMVRTPGGAINDTIRTNVGAPIILWSLDTLDWKTRDTTAVYNAIINNAADGDIVLLHDLYKTSIDGALQAIDVLQSKGFECVTVAELMRRRGVTLENGQTYTNAPKHEEAGTLPAYTAPVLTSEFNNDLMHTVVTITSPNPSMKIYYTTDDSEPDLSSNLYTEPVQLSRSCTFKVVAIDDYGTKTPVASEMIDVPSTPTPTVSYENNKLKIETTDSDARIYYTVDATEPTLNSIEYKKPFEVTSSIIKCIAGEEGSSPSEVVTCSFTTNKNMITDILPEKWYYNTVLNALNQEVMVEYSPYHFEPDKEMTKEDFVNSIFTMATSRVIPTCKIKNVDSPVDWAVSKNIIVGTDGLSKTITREEAALMLYNFAVNVYCNPCTERMDSTNISDSKDISGVYMDAVSWCAFEGVMNVDDTGMFYPKQSMTRAQAASILLRFRDSNSLK